MRNRYDVKSQSKPLQYGICSDDDIFFDEIGPVIQEDDTGEDVLTPYIVRIFCNGSQDFENSPICKDHQLRMLGPRVSGLGHSWKKISDESTEQLVQTINPIKRLSMVGGGMDDETRIEAQKIVTERSTLGFFRLLLRFKYTIVYEIWPQLLIQLAINTFAQFSMHLREQPIEIPSDWKKAFDIFLVIVGYFLVIRADQAYTHFLDGAENLEQLTGRMCALFQMMYTYKARPGADPERLLLLRKNIRRKTLLLFSFIRQEVRESNFGFMPGISATNLEFSTDWHRDPCEPPIANLMSKEEKEMYATVPVCDRPTFVGAEISVIGNELASHLKNSGFFTHAFHEILGEIFKEYDEIVVIAETVIPDNFHHFLYLLTFCVCQFTPWMYLDSMTNTLTGWFVGWFGGIMVCSAYYGILVMAAKLHNPFGFDFVDLDLECYGLRIHNEGLHISQTTGSRDYMSYTQRYL